MILRISNVTKKFGGLTALENISFELEKGKILGLIGPNGAGKTTLFNCINGTLKIDDGSVFFDGKDITNMKLHEIAKLGICRSYQIVKPFGNMLVIENVMVGAFCRVKNYHEARDIAYSALKTVGLEKKAEVKAATLNLGERKKLEIAKALSTAPKLLLLDEVMAGLLPAEVQEMTKIIKGINKAGTSIIVIEHIMEAVMTLSDDILVLNFGKKLAYGSPQEIAENEDVIEAYLGKGGDDFA